MKRTGFVIATFILTAGAVSAWGQPLQTTGRSLINRQAPEPGSTGFRTGLSGVKAKVAPPIQRLGGVKAEIPHAMKGIVPSHRLGLPGPIKGLPQINNAGPRPGSNRAGGVRVGLPSSHGFDGTFAPTSADTSPLSAPRPGIGFNRTGDSVYRRFGNVSSIDSTGIAPVLSSDRVSAVFTSGSGLTVNGTTGNDQFRLGFHLGAGYGALRRHGRFHHGRYVSPYAAYWPYGDAFGYGSWYAEDSLPIYGGSYGYVDPNVANGMQRTQTAQPPAVPAPPPPPATALEAADVALSEGRSADAILAYREHLKSAPEDAPAMRRLALAFVANRKYKEGVAMMAYAYEKDRTLARTPIDPEVVASGLSGMRELLLGVAPYANKTKSSSGWLTVAIIMQSEGRNAQALKMVRKAKEAGLDPQLASELEIELGR